MRIFSRIHPGEYESKRRHLHCHRRARESSRADDIWTSAGSTTSRVSLLLIFLFSSKLTAAVPLPLRSLSSPTGAVAHRQPELTFVLDLLVFYFTVWSCRPTPGATPWSAHAMTLVPCVLKALSFGRKRTRDLTGFSPQAWSL